MLQGEFRGRYLIPPGHLTRPPASSTIKPVASHRSSTTLDGIKRAKRIKSPHKTLAGEARSIEKATIRKRERAELKHKETVLLKKFARRVRRQLPASRVPSREHTAAMGLARSSGAGEVEPRFDLVLARWRSTPRKEVLHQLETFGFKALSHPYFNWLGPGWLYYDCTETPQGASQ